MNIDDEDARHISRALQQNTVIFHIIFLRFYDITF